MIQLLYADDRAVVCVKPAGVLSTDEPGGVPELVRGALGDPEAVVHTVHRLDRVVGGVMVLARTARAARELSAQIREGSFQKTYLAVCRGTPEREGVLEDLLRRDPAERKTSLVQAPGRDVQLAVLRYETLAEAGGLALLRIRLETGRTHQIRAQLSGHGHPLAGDRKYGVPDGWDGIGLWSHSVGFRHPRTGERMVFTALPPDAGVWQLFRAPLAGLEGQKADEPVDQPVEGGG